MATDVFKQYDPFKGTRTTPQADFGSAFQESLKMSFKETPFASLLTGLELSNLKDGQTEPYQGLNEEFGLNLEEDTTRAYAERLKEIRDEEARQQSIVNEGFANSPKLGVVAGFGASLIAESLDPINIGASLAMGFGASKVFSKALAVKNSNAVSQSIVSAGRAMKARPLTASMAEGVVGNLIADSFVVWGNDLKQSEIGMAEVMALSASTGALFPLLGDLIKKAFKKADTKFQGSDTEPVPRKDILAEERATLLGDSKLAIEESNQRFEALEVELRKAEAKSALTPLQAKERNIELDRIRGEIRNVKEFRNAIIKTETDLSKIEFEASKRVSEIDADIKKADTEIKRIDSQPKDRNLTEKRKEQVTRKAELVERKKTLESAREEAIRTRDSVINRDKEIYDLDALLFNNKDFDFATLHPDHHASLIEYHKNAFNNGRSPDIEGAHNSIQKKQVLPEMEKEITQLESMEGPLTAKQNGRLEYLNRKAEELRELPDVDPTKQPKKLYEKSDPDEVYKNMPVDEMENKVYADRVVETEEVIENLKTAKTESERALECLLGSL